MHITRIHESQMLETLVAIFLYFQYKLSNIK